jgi:hypothetical protein
VQCQPRAEVPLPSQNAELRAVSDDEESPRKRDGNEQPQAPSKCESDESAHVPCRHRPSDKPFASAPIRDASAPDASNSADRNGRNATRRRRLGAGPRHPRAGTAPTNTGSHVHALYSSNMCPRYPPVASLHRRSLNTVATKDHENGRGGNGYGPSEYHSITSRDATTAAMLAERTTGVSPAPGIA